jgi:DNA-binding NarL/FixJ family response regulator
MRILLADDHELFRDGLASLLVAWGHEVVGQVGNGADAIAAAERLHPELVLMDVRMPGMTGLEATRALLTVSEDEADLFAAIKAGARGYLFKSLESTQLRRMLEAVERGEAAITPATAGRIIAELARPSDSRHVQADALTPREVEVLELVTAGLRNKEIAARLGISENTAKYHLRNILEKLQAESRTELAARAVREHLV